MSLTHGRDCQSGVDVQATVTIVMADSNIQFLEQSNNQRARKETQVTFGSRLTSDLKVTTDLCVWVCPGEVE